LATVKDQSKFDSKEEVKMIGKMKTKRSTSYFCFWKIFLIGGLAIPPVLVFFNVSGATDYPNRSIQIIVCANPSLFQVI
jgi:hypothetical protein